MNTTTTITDEIGEMNECNEARSSSEGWEQLMGNDIILKVTKNQNFYAEGGKIVVNEDEKNGVVTGEASTIDSDFIPENKVEQGEIGDYILIDFDGYCNPNDKNYIDQQGSKEKNEPFIYERDWLITLGQGDVTPGLEMAIRFLSLNQCGIVKCHSKYAYGLPGRKGFLCTTSKSTRYGDIIGAVPANTNVLYKIRIKAIIPQHDPKAQSHSFQIKLFQQMKNIGNYYYKNDWVHPDGGLGKTKSLKLYNTVAKDGIALLQDLEHGSQERREIFYITVDSLNNIAAAHLREKEYRKAKDAATQAIQLDPYNLKALCRAAKAAMMIGEFEECKMALEAAEDVAETVVDSNEGYTEKDVKKLKRELITKKREYKKLEKEIYAQMLSSKNDGTKKKKKKASKIEKKKSESNGLLQKPSTSGAQRENNNLQKPSNQKDQIPSKVEKEEESSQSMFYMHVVILLIAIALWFWRRDHSEVK